MEEVPVTMPDLGGKRVLITGAAQRLGAVIARAFAECGAAVVVHCFRSKDDAEKLVASLPPCPAPFQHEVVSCDLADLDAVRRMAEAVGPVDYLVNNAAMWIRGDAPRSELDRQETVNHLAPHVRVNAVAPGPVFPPRELGDAGMKHIPATLPLKHPVAPEDVARAVVFLASTPSVTGAVLPVDCGQSLLFPQP